MRGKLRIGLIGAGLIGRKHADTIAAFGNCTLAAVADPMPQAENFAAAYGATLFSDYRVMLDEAKLDGVIIASPNAFHVPMALDCQERRLPCLIEKPVAESMATGLRLAESVMHSGVPVLVGHHRRHNPLVHRARAIVQGGGIGRLTAVHVMFLLKKPDDYFKVEWRTQPGAGPVLVNLIHDIDNLRYICGEIESVQAMLSNQARGYAVEDTACLLLRFANGALGTATISDAVPAPWSWELTAGENPSFPQQNEHCAMFCGSAGSLAFPRLSRWFYDGDGAWTDPIRSETVPVEHAEPFPAQLQHFLTVIGGAPPLVTVNDALRTLAVVEAVKVAAAEQRLVAVSEMLSAGGH